MCEQTLINNPFVPLVVSAGAALVSTLIYFCLVEPEGISLSETAIAIAGAGAVAGVVALAGVLGEAEFGAVVLALVGALAGAVAEVGVGAVVGAVVGVGAVEVAVAGVLVEAEFGALALAVAGGVAEAVAGGVAEAVVRVGAGAEAFIVVIPGFVSCILLQCFAGSPTLKHILRVLALGLPLMTIAWLVSLDRFVAANASAHETMQNEFYFFFE